MTPEQIYHEFLEDIRSADDRITLPSEFLAEGQEDLPASGIFNQNWERLEAFLPEETKRFRELLAKALKKGRKRPHKQHDPIVHFDWIIKDQDQWPSPFLERYLQGLRDRIQGLEPIFITSPNNMGISKNDPRWKELGGPKIRRVDSTIHNGGLNGFMDLKGLDRLFKAMDGYHPEDSFTVHGGQWHACLTHCQLQLLGITMGKYWPAAGETWPALPDKLLQAQRYIIFEAHKEAEAMKNVPVNTGLAMDQFDLFNSFKYGIQFDSHAKVSLAFYREGLSEIFNYDKYSQMK